MKKLITSALVLLLTVGLYAASDTTIVTITVTNNDVDWCNLQHPASGTVSLGGEFNVYARVYEPGLTDSEGRGDTVAAWIGYSTTDSDPSEEGWTWISAEYNGDKENNDEYMANLGNEITAAGTYYFASRFSLDSTNYKYGGYSEDGGGFWDGSDYVNSELTVVENQAPVLTTIGGQSLNEDQADTLILEASDPDDDSVTFSVSGGSAGTITATINEDTLFLNPAENYNSETGIELTVTADDGQGGTDSETFTVTVAPVNDAPVITAIDNQEFAEGDQITLTLEATDPDNDDLTWTAENMPEGATLTNNNDNTATFEWKPDYTQSGEYEITFIVDDGVEESQAAVNVDN